MIEYSFWTKDKVDGVEALVFSNQFNQNTFTSMAVLEDIVGQHPEEAKATRKAIVLPDPVLDGHLVYNGKSAGRTYLTEVAFKDGTIWSDSHKIAGVRSIAYPTDRPINTIKAWEVKSATDKKQVFELSL